MIDVIRKGSTSQSIIFALSEVVAVTSLKLQYCRWSDGDGTTWGNFTEVALTELASISTAYTSGYARFVTSLDDPNKFLIRVDTPDAVWAVGRDRVAITIWNEADVVAHREFILGDIKLNSLDITRADDGVAVKATGKGTDGHGVELTGGAGNAGDGAGGDGVKVTGGLGGTSDGNGGQGMRLEGGDADGSGSDGAGLWSEGGDAAGGAEGIRAEGKSNSDGIKAQGGSAASAAGNGIRAVGGTSTGSNGGEGLSLSGGSGVNDAAGGHGMESRGTGAGSGVQAEGGGTDGSAGLKATSTATNGKGAHILGSGSQAGLLIENDDTGLALNVRSAANHGAAFEAESGDKAGLYAEGAGDGAGVHGKGGDTGDGIKGEAATDGNGIRGIGGSNTGSGGYLSGDGNGDGLNLTGGSTDGNNGLQANVNATNGNGIKAAGTGTGQDFKVEMNKGVELLGFNDLDSSQVQAACDAALDAYDSGNGVATQSSVDSIQNNTRFVASISTYYLVPAAGENIYKLGVNFYDTAGNMEDPDSNDIGLDLDFFDGTDKNGILFKDSAGLTPLDASGIAGHMKLERTDVGQYFCYVKIESTETAPNQFVYDFALVENSINLYYSRKNNMLDSDPATVNANVVEWLGTAVTADTAGVPNTNVKAWDNNTTIDGKSLIDFTVWLLARAAGDVVRTGNSYAFKKQDGVATAFSFTISTGGRA